MWKRVEEVVEDLRPLIKSVGIDAEVVDVINNTVTLKLSRVDRDSSPDLARLRSFVAKEIQAEMPDVTEVTFEGELAPPPAPKPGVLAMTYDTPAADADTVVITFERAVAPPATTVYDSLEIAADRPVVLAIMRVAGVVSVIGRDTRLIVARSMETGWDVLLPALQAAVDSAAAGSAGEVAIRERVELILERDVNPQVASHGGYIELLDVRGTELFIHMGGGCQGCSQSQATLRMGVEQQIKNAVPEVTAIFDTTDHAAGENPYFKG
ncbi:MAG: NifU family protein [Myxococcota bacterium]